MDLDTVPLWSDRRDIGVDGLWKAYCQFPYLPRLASFEVLANAVSDGVSKLNWVDETFAYADGHDGDKWVGLTIESHVSTQRRGLLVHPVSAQEQLDRAGKPIPDRGPDPTAGPSRGNVPEPKPAENAPTRYYAQFNISGVRAIKQLEDILQNVVDQLNKAPGAIVALTLEINATATGFGEQTIRVVRENSGQLGAKGNEFEI